MARSRLYRLGQRIKKIFKRKKQLDNHHWSKEFRPVDGKLDNHSALTCPGGKSCILCHPSGGREKTLQEKRIDIDLEEFIIEDFVD